MKFELIANSIDLPKDLPDKKAQSLQPLLSAMDRDVRMKVKNLVPKVSEKLDYDILGASLFALWLLEDVNAHEEMVAIQPILLRALRKSNLI